MGRGLYSSRASSTEEEEIGTLGRLYRTGAPLGPRRVLLRALRPARARWRRILWGAGRGPGPMSWRGVPLASWPTHEESWTPPGRFRFQAVERDLGSGPVWTETASRLWDYHLHYLDALRQESVPVGERRRLLESWIAGNPPGSSPGWEPYPTALRLVNVLGFLGGAMGEPPPPTLLESVALQAWWLSGTMEWDVGANHLWKDALALSWAGRFLSGGSATGWRRGGDDLLRRQLHEQLLEDGFHLERTPTYHALLVEDLLRLDALLTSDREEGPLAAEVKLALGRAGEALATVLHPDGEVALLNDSAFGQAPRGDRLVAEVARRLGRPLSPIAGGLEKAGILRLESGGSVVLFDVGETGDRVQPGHAHADTLTFELSMMGRRVIVDAGVHDYTLSETRRYARSTRAHNTVTVDDADQSEMWGVFRVGRRARPMDVAWDAAAAHPWATGAHDGYAVLDGAPIHRRRIEALGDARWRIHDEVAGAGRHRVRAALRVHPAFTARAADATGREWSVEADGIRLVLSWESGPPPRLEEGWYFPRLGEKLECAVLVQEVEADLPIRLSCRIEVR